MNIFTMILYSRNPSFLLRFKIRKYDFTIHHKLWLSVSMKLILIRLFHCFFIRFKIQYIVSKDYIMYVNWRLVRVVTSKIQLSFGGKIEIKKIFTLIIWFAFLDRNIATLVLVHQSFQLTILWQQLGLFLFQLVYIFGSLLKYRSLE